MEPETNYKAREIRLFSVKHVQIQQFQVTYLKWCSLKETERLWNKGNNLQVKSSSRKCSQQPMWHLLKQTTHWSMMDRQTDGRKVMLVYACTITKLGKSHFVLQQETDENHEKFSFCKYNITPSRTRYFTKCLILNNSITRHSAAL